MDNSEKPEENKKTHLQKAVSSALPATLPPEFLKSLLVASTSIQYYAEQNRKILEKFSVNIFPSSKQLFLMSEISKIVKTQSQFFNFNKELILSPAFEQASAVSKSIERLLAIETPQINKLFESLAYQSIAWKEQQSGVAKIVETLQKNAIWQSHFLDISKFALLSQTSLLRISLEQIGNALELRVATQSIVKNTFREFSRAYEGLYEALESQPITIVSFPPAVSRLPAIEFFNGVSLIDSITIPTEIDIEFEQEKLKVTKDTKEETDDRLEYLLNELNAEFIVPLQGARLSLNSTNPDRIRHFAISLRELFDHILHTLAPDDEVKKWSNLPEYFDKGKPTRKVRLLYICRNLNHDSFSEFVEKDIASVLAFLQLFQQGTHEMASRYTDLQLTIMLLRMETTIRFLLEIWHAR